MKIHMDYLEGKVEKFEKEQSIKEDLVKRLNRQISNLEEKY